MQDSRSNADWLSFVLHYLFGLVVGALVGLFAICRNYNIWLKDPLILPFLAGAALLVAGLGARWGDRLWMSSSDSVFGSDAPRHNRLSAWLCSLSMVSGAVLVGTSLFKQFGG